jgi:rubrerythrin
MKILAWRRRGDRRVEGSMRIRGEAMTVEEAIKTGILFETKVHATYLSAARRAEDPIAKKVFTTLAEEEQGHINYLQSRLSEWRKDGRMSDEKLRTVLPAAERIRAGVKRLRSQVAQRKGSHAPELDSLRQALAAEEETSAFYLLMVRELPAEGQELFSRFLEIEDGHAAVVQAEIDNVNQMGFWFDLKEFDLELG